MDQRGHHYCHHLHHLHHHPLLGAMSKTLSPAEVEQLKLGGGKLKLHLPPLLFLLLLALTQNLELCQNVNFIREPVKNVLAEFVR